MRQIRCASKLKFNQAKISIAFIAILLAFQFKADAASISPSSIAFRGHVNEKILILINVDLGIGARGILEAEIDGFKCDRRISQLESGRYKVEIAPDTAMEKSIAGQVKFKFNGKNVGSPVTICGSIVSWIKAQPSRLFVGPIGKGKRFIEPQTFEVSLISEGESFDIESVAFSDIDGGVWQSKPPRGQLSTAKILSLKFSPNAVAGNLPFGALAAKYVLVKTTNPHLPSLTIPIYGMISVNTANRDYSQYLYKGNLRWKGRWGNPNLAAAFLGGVMVFIVGFAAALRSRLHGYSILRIILDIIYLIILIIGCYFLTQTYSRGGWIATFAGILTLIVGLRKNCIYPIVFGILFVIFISFQPNGLDRSISPIQVTADKSIYHRLLLWRSALQIMIEHPWRGVGEGNFGDTYFKYYRDPAQEEKYSTAVNDVLTFGAERGIPLLVLTLCTIYIIALTGIRNGIYKNKEYLIGCSATIITFFIASCFSSVIFKWDSSLMISISVLGIIGDKIPSAVRNDSTSVFRKLNRGFFEWALAGVLLLSICILLGFTAMIWRPKISSTEISGIKGLVISPRWGNTKGTILYLGDYKDTPESLLQNTLMPLAKKRWLVYCFNLPTFASDGNIALQKLGNQIRQIDCVAGHGQGAQLALLAVSRIRSNSVACYQSSSASAFSDFNPDYLVQEIKRPLLVCTQEVTNSLEFLAIEKAAKKAHCNLTCEVYRGYFGSSNMVRQLWISSLDNFASCNSYSSR